ncbi:MAG: endonuclease [Candidatus Fimimonas sp.]
MRKTAWKTIICCVLLVAMFAAFVPALQPVATAATSVESYYANVTATSGTALLGQLHDLITTTHTRYTTYDDCKNPTYVKKTDAGSNASSVLEFYSQADIASSWGGGSTGTWNREHVWCQSLSNGLWGTSGGGSDLHHIRPVETTLNSARGNNKFGEVVDGTAAYYKDSNKNPVALGGYNKSGVFEPLDSVKGDVARIVMYVYTHYNNYNNVGGTTNGKGSANYFGTLNFTNVISASSEDAAIQLLLKWNKNDPVDDSERNRNDAVAEIEGNRNPFVDNEQYADAIWGGKSLETDELQSLKLNYTSLTLSENVTATLKVTAVPATANDSVTWTSSNTNVATVSAAGVVTAISQGTATITATSKENSNIKATATVTVKAMSSITVSGTPTKAEYVEGEVFDPTGLTVTAHYSDGSQENLPLESCTWLDAVTQKSALSAGTTQVLCKIGNLSQVVGGITVKLDSSVARPVDMSNLQENTPYKLMLYSANLDKTLYIVNAIYSNYYMASAEKIEESSDVFVELLQDGFHLYFQDGSEKTYLNAEVSGTHINLVPRSNPTVVWNYDETNKCICTDVEMDGATKTVFIGTYNYYSSFSVSTTDKISTGFAAYLASTKTEEDLPVDSVELSKTSISLQVGQTETVVATATGDVTWTSSDESVATVSNGVITAVGAGTATITVTCKNATAICIVTVTKVGTSEEFSAAVAAIEQANSLSERFEAIKKAIAEYQSLPESDKAAVSADFDKLQTAICNYNTQVSAYNTQSVSNVNNVFVGIFALASAFVAAFLLKRKWL